MKKMFALVAAAAALFVFTPTPAEAGGYRSKIIGKCQHCKGNIYSYHKPVRYSHGRAVYGWVPAYHSKCAASHARSRSNSYYQARPQIYSGSRYYNNSGLYVPRSYYQRPTYRSYGGSGVSFSFSFGGNRYCR